MNRLLILGILLSATTFSLNTQAAPITVKELDSDQIILGRAQEKWNQGDVASAKRLYMEVLELNPGNTNALVGMAQVEESLGNTDAAESLFKKAFKSNDKNAVLHTAHGQFLLKQNRVEEAVSALEKALKIDPGAAQAHVELAVIKMSRFGDPASAVGHYQKALQTKPLETSYLYGLSLALERSGKIKEAIAPLDRIISFDPSLSLPFKLKGKYFLVLRQYDQAISNLKMANDKSNNLTALDLIRLGDVYAESGDGENAIDIYEKAMAQFGENEVVITKIAFVHHMSGDIKKAESLYRKAIKMKTSYSDPYNNMAYIELKHNNDPNEALAFAKKAVEFSPKNPNFLDTLGVVYLALNDHSKAEDVFQQALKLDPRNAEIQQNLAKAKRAR